MSSDILIAAARRTPIGKFLGVFAGTPAVELGAVAARAALADAALAPERIDAVVFGHARQAGCGPNPARQVQSRAGIPLETPAFTINQACASGLQAIAAAARLIRTGEARCVLAGGMESMSRVPFLLDRGRQGYHLGHGEVIDGMVRDGFMCPLCSELMGETAETLASEYSISREEQDTYAVESQARASRATFDGELAPVNLPEGDPVRVDEHPRADTTLEKLSRLPPVFRRNGTVHAGNSSGITDGAAALVVCTPESLQVEPLARITGWAAAGVDPRRMGLGPVPATRKLLERIGGSLDDFDLIELNEAFAAQVIACEREMKLDRARLNVNGGAIALGHPIGATGARVTVTLLHEMRRRGVRRGMATLCVSGGQGMSLAVERS